MIEVASPAAATEPAPVHCAASDSSWLCCNGTTDPVSFVANAEYSAAAEASCSSSTFGQPGPVTVCDPYGLTSACNPMTRLPFRAYRSEDRHYRRSPRHVCGTWPRFRPEVGTPVPAVT